MINPIIPPALSETAVISALSAIAQSGRLAIFRALVQAGPTGLAAGKISDITGIAPSSLSFHLKELSHAQMVSAVTQGRFVIYSANFDTMNQVLAYLTANCCAGVGCELEAASPCCPPLGEPS